MSNNWWGYTTNQLNLQAISGQNRWLPRVINYGEALKIWWEIRPLRGQPEDAPRPIGYRSRRNIKTVRKEPNGDIVFRIYENDAVTWHPNGTFTVQGYPSRTTGMFINMLTPLGVYYWSGQGVLALDAVDGGWKERPLVRCGRGERVRVTKRKNVWMPAEPAALAPFEYEVLDRAKARKLGQRLGLTDFTHWLNAYEKLGGEVGRLGYPLFTNEHRHELLEAKDYHALMRTFCTVRNWRQDPQGKWGWSDDRVSRTDVGKFRAWLYVKFGATKTKKAKQLTRAEHYNHIERNRYRRYK
jgi:hypothetical protein